MDLPEANLTQVLWAESQVNLAAGKVLKLFRD